MISTIDTSGSELVTVTAGPDSGLLAVIETILSVIINPHTKRVRRAALVHFADWRQAAGGPDFTKATVARYVGDQVGAGVSASMINARLTAVKLLAREAADNGYLGADGDHIAAAIGRVKGVSVNGQRLGNWLSRSQAERLIGLPDRTTLKGLRDRALLALLVGAGLRRQEAADLTFGHIQMRESRWVIVDLVGKHSKRRSIPIPAWVKAAVDEWGAAAGISDGRILRAVRRGGHVDGAGMSPQAILDVVAGYCGDLGLKDVRPHDLRRTFAKLSHKGGAPVDQISKSLGHESIQTTERYLGIDQNLVSAPADFLLLNIK